MVDLPTINELLNDLTKESPDQFVYRGQSRHYGTVLPSRLRGLAEPIVGSPGTYRLPRARIVAQRTLRQENQEGLRGYLVSRFGMALGNLFSQQYMATSDVVDVTENPAIACFFATRLWPRCEHIDSSDAPGVIYRWKKPGARPRELAAMMPDLVLGHLDINGGSSTEIPSRFAWATRNSPESRRVGAEPNSSFTLRPDMITHEEARTLVDDFYSRADSESSALYHSLHGFDATRWATQEGGSFRPWLSYPSWSTFIAGSKEPIFEVDEELGVELIRNLKVYIGEPNAVHDILATGAPDVFHFRHTSSPIDFDLRDLWPPVSVDYIYFTLATLAWVSNESYLTEAGCGTSFDPYAGVIDGGPHPVPVTDSYLRRQFTDFWAARKATMPASGGVTD